MDWFKGKSANIVSDGLRQADQEMVWYMFDIKSYNL